MTLDELNQVIERDYTCMVGVPRAFFDIPLSRELAEQLPSDVSPFLRIKYETVAVAMIGEAERIGTVLCEWAAAKFHDLQTEEERQDRTTLVIWRVKPMLAEFQNAQGRVCTSLRMRLCMPGKDLTPLISAEGMPRWL